MHGHELLGISRYGRGCGCEDVRVYGYAVPWMSGVGVPQGDPAQVSAGAPFQGGLRSASAWVDPARAHARDAPAAPWPATPGAG